MLLSCLDLPDPTLASSVYSAFHNLNHSSHLFSFTQIDLYLWAYTGHTGSSSDANPLTTIASAASSPFLTIAGNAIGSIPAGNHTVQLTVTNFLGEGSGGGSGESRVQ